MEYILDGMAHGDVATRLLNNNFDQNILRPYIGDNGDHYITVNQGGKDKAHVVGNNTATLRKDDWKLLDTAVVKAAKERLRFVADLRSSGLTYSIPQGMGKTVLETETQSDINPAQISMDAVQRGKSDRPVYELSNLPLPIIHKDFSFSARQIQTSRNGGSPLDTSMAELAARRVAETAEQLAIGTLSTYSYGGGTIYGARNFPQRLTKSMTNPTSTGWTGKTAVSEVLAMKAQSQAALHYGPWRLYTSPAWDQYLDADYSDAKGDNTLRERIAKIEGINSVATLDTLPGYEMILIQQTSDVFREVMGMDITTVQWASEGGMQFNYKVMAIMVPQPRADQNGNTGIVHGVVS